MTRDRDKIAGWAAKICEDRFDGNQSSMAEAIEWTQSSLNRALRLQTKGEKTYLDLVKDIVHKLGYAQDEWRTFNPLVERQDILTDAAIIFRNAHTQKIWATAELILRVRVHEPMEIIGGQGRNDGRADAE